MAIIYTFNNLDSHFRPYLAILSHHTWEKEKLSTLSKLTKALEDEQLRLSNKNRRIANYACSSKTKKAKPSEQREKRRIGKGYDNEGEKKRQEMKECKTYGGKYHGDCWHLKTECFIYHNMGHIATKCPKKSSNLISSSLSKKKLYYAQKVTHHPILKTKVS